MSTICPVFDCDQDSHTGELLVVTVSNRDILHIQDDQWRSTHRTDRRHLLSRGDADVLFGEVDGEVTRSRRWLLLWDYSLLVATRPILTIIVVTAAFRSTSIILRLLLLVVKINSIFGARAILRWGTLLSCIDCSTFAIASRSISSPSKHHRRLGVRLLARGTSTALSVHLRLRRQLRLLAVIILLSGQ